MKNIALKIILSSAVLVTVFCALKWYYTPVPADWYPDGITLCNEDGDIITAKFQLYYQRRLFQRKRLEGSIFIDGTEYIGRDGRLFCQPGTLRTVILYAAKPEINYIGLFPPGGGRGYIGPAENVQEYEAAERRYSEAVPELREAQHAFYKTVKKAENVVIRFSADDGEDAVVYETQNRAEAEQLAGMFFRWDQEEETAPQEISTGLAAAGSVDFGGLAELTWLGRGEEGRYLGEINGGVYYLPESFGEFVEAQMLKPQKEDK